MTIRVAIETIKTQSPTFFKELAVAYESLRQNKNTDITHAEEVFLIAKIIKHHTNMEIDVHIETNGLTSVGPAIMPPDVSKNHPLFNAMRREYFTGQNTLNEAAKAGGELRGMVNIKTGRVSGYFASVTGTFYMPASLINNPKFSPEELAAITLHECGHMFTYFEYIARSLTTNYSLLALQESLSTVKTPDERETIMVSFGKAARIGPEKLEELSKTTNDKVISAVVLTAAAEESYSELGANIYDSTAWEYLSDAYARAYQAGLPLTTALDKLYRANFNISFRSMPVYLFYEAFKLVAIGLSIWSGGLGLGIALMLFAMDGASEDYDTPEARFKRVKMEIIKDLKNPHISKQDAKRLTDDVAAIDTLLETIHDKRQFIGVLWDWVTVIGQKKVNYINFQKQLEEFASNDLFAKAAQLRLAFQ